MEQTLAEELSDLFGTDEKRYDVVNILREEFVVADVRIKKPTDEEERLKCSFSGFTLFRCFVR